MLEDIEDWFVHGDQQHFRDLAVSYHQTIDKTSGRVEIRRCWAISDPVAFEYIRHYQAWPDLRTIVRVQRECRVNGVTARDTAYYISSLPNEAQPLLEATRHHWAIENSFHWVLDVTFREDDSRIRKGDSPQNMAVLRHLALTILNQDPSTSRLKQKRFRAGLDEAYLFALLTRV